MSKTPIRRKKFKIIAGGLHRKISFEPVRIVAAPENSTPFQVDALVFEEDTWLVMSANPTICEPEVHPIRLMTDYLKQIWLIVPPKINTEIGAALNAELSTS